MHRFRLGTVLGTGFRIWLRNAPSFLLITAILLSPFLIWAVALVQGEPTLEVRRADVERYLDATAFTPLFTILASTGLVYGVVKELSGEHAPFLRCFGAGLARFVPALGAAVLATIAVIAGLIAWMVPGVIAMCMLYVTTQAAVLERPGTFGALARSYVLTRGHRVEIFAILLLFWVTNRGVSFAIGLALEGAMQDASIHDAVRLAVYLDLAHTVIVASLASVVASTAYHHLRLEKEGTSAGELAQVFA
jgi:hypothetical protein